MEGIQQTIFTAFKGAPSFTVSEAYKAVLEKKNVNTESIRARLYEGVSKGLFDRISRGVYKICKDASSVLCILGDGRDLSDIPDSSISAIVTDHPYEDKKAHQGGNREFASYECFRYTKEDFEAKFRVLIDGGFLVEFLPAESESNFEYLYQLKKFALDAGFMYYAKVNWKKGKFVANTGRSSKNTEEIMIFSKGKPRSLRPDVKKDLKEPGQKHYMSGTAKMLPTCFDYDPPNQKNRIHQAEKPVELLEDLLSYISLEDEVILDQFAGSGNLGVACLKTKRNAILIEKSKEIFDKMVNNLKKTGSTCLPAF